VAGVTRLLAGTVAAGTAGFLVAAALAAPGDPKFVPRAADQAYARTILLRASELPGKGWTGMARDFSGPNPACVVKHFSMSALTEHGRVGRSYDRTPAPAHGTFQVESDALVFATSAQAASAFALVTSIGLARCIAAATVANPPPGRHATFEVRARTLSGLSVSTGGFQIVFRLSAGTQHRTVNASLAALRRGSTVATLEVITNGPAIPQAQMRSLAAKMASRMTRP
jgi:hypothetical protein